MTEEEAKTKWCPFVRHADAGGGSFNRGSEANNPTNQGRVDGGWSCTCIASACMAWQTIYSPRGATGVCGLTQK